MSEISVRGKNIKLGNEKQKESFAQFEKLVRASYDSNINSILNNCNVFSDEIVTSSDELHIDGSKIDINDLDISIRSTDRQCTIVFTDCTINDKTLDIFTSMESSSLLFIRCKIEDLGSLVNYKKTDIISFDECELKGDCLNNLKYITYVKVWFIKTKVDLKTLPSNCKILALSNAEFDINEIKYLTNLDTLTTFDAEDKLPTGYFLKAMMLPNLNNVHFGFKDSSASVKISKLCYELLSNKSKGVNRATAINHLCDQIIDAGYEDYI